MADGKFTMVKTAPLSSFGTSAPGVALNSATTRPIKTATINKLGITWRKTFATPAVKTRVEKSKNSFFLI